MLGCVSFPVSVSTEYVGLEEQHNNLLKIRDCALIKDAFYSTAAYFMSMTVVGLPLGIYMLHQNPYSRRINEAENEIWILENVPGAMKDPVWKGKFITVLSEMNEYEASLRAPLLYGEEYFFQDELIEDVSAMISMCWRRIDDLKRQFLELKNY